MPQQSSTTQSSTSRPSITSGTTSGIRTTGGAIIHSGFLGSGGSASAGGTTVSVGKGGSVSTSQSQPSSITTSSGATISPGFLTPGTLTTAGGTAVVKTTGGQVLTANIPTNVDIMRTWTQYGPEAARQQAQLAQAIKDSSSSGIQATQPRTSPSYTPTSNEVLNVWQTQGLEAARQKALEQVQKEKQMEFVGPMPQGPIARPLPTADVNKFKGDFDKFTADITGRYGGQPTPSFKEQQLAGATELPTFPKDPYGGLKTTSSIASALTNLYNIVTPRQKIESPVATAITGARENLITQEYQNLERFKGVIEQEKKEIQTQQEKNMQLAQEQGMKIKTDAFEKMLGDQKFSSVQEANAYLFKLAAEGKAQLKTTADAGPVKEKKFVTDEKGIIQISDINLPAEEMEKYNKLLTETQQKNLELEKPLVQKITQFQTGLSERMYFEPFDKFQAKVASVREATPLWAKPTLSPFLIGADVWTNVADKALTAPKFFTSQVGPAAVLGTAVGTKLGPLYGALAGAGSYALNVGAPIMVESFGRTTSPYKESELNRFVGAGNIAAQKRLEESAKFSYSNLGPLAKPVGYVSGLITGDKEALNPRKFLYDLTQGTAFLDKNIPITAIKEKLMYDKNLSEPEAQKAAEKIYADEYLKRAFSIGPQLLQEISSEGAGLLIASKTSPTGYFDYLAKTVFPVAVGGALEGQGAYGTSSVAFRTPMTEKGMREAQLAGIEQASAANLLIGFGYTKRAGRIGDYLRRVGKGVEKTTDYPYEPIGEALAKAYYKVFERRIGQVGTTPIKVALETPESVQTKGGAFEDLFKTTAKEATAEKPSFGQMVKMETTQKVQEQEKKPTKQTQMYPVKTGQTSPVTIPEKSTVPEQVPEALRGEYRANVEIPVSTDIQAKIEPDIKPDIPTKFETKVEIPIEPKFETSTNIPIKTGMGIAPFMFPYSSVGLGAGSGIGGLGGRATRQWTVLNPFRDLGEEFKKKLMFNKYKYLPTSTGMGTKLMTSFGATKGLTMGAMSAAGKKDLSKFLSKPTKRVF